LFISYDGLLDPLGQSQILPYIMGIVKHTRPIHVLSFEKNFRIKDDNIALNTYLKEHGIYWHPLIFSYNKGFWGFIKKIWDFLLMYIFTFFIVIRFQVEIIHARSYLAGFVGLSFKRLFGVKFLFDCRGLWVDERVDKGIWNLQKFTHRWQYLFLKYKEISLFQKADQIVVLTKAVIPEILKIGRMDSNLNITVIPCCADYDFFNPLIYADKIKIREKIGISKDSLVLGYLGSVGSMYMIDEFLLFFAMAVKKHFNVVAFIVTPDIEEVNLKINSISYQHLGNKIYIKDANRNQVPYYLGVFDILVSFIKPTYAKIASSPTKNAEALAMGIPLICNYGVGDLEEFFELVKAGKIIKNTSDEEMIKVVEDLFLVKSLGGRKLREESKKWFSLELANKKYKNVYKNI
jgi:glycosyltransferase involved in cell wall biosynthesis